MKTPSRIFICALFLGLLVSCKKNRNDTPYYHFRFKINGNWTTWSKVSADIAPDQLDNTKTNFTLTATSQDEKEIFGISIQTDGPDFPPKQYSTTDPSDVVYISYVKQSSTDIRFYGAETGSGLEPSVYSVQINSITDDEVRGTFSGNYLYDNYNEQTASIREGEFVLPRIK